jgi:exopolysaccharide biosynthesis polyprenyl glycosylphosphotransferase
MNSAVARVVEIEEAPAPAGPLRPFDVRLRREIAHRRLVISMVRRFLRVAGLHTLDALVLGIILLSVGKLLPSFWGIGEYTLAIVGIALLSLNAMSAYDPGDGRRDHRRLLSGLVLALLILSCLTVFPPQLSISIQEMLAFGALGFAGLAAGREAVDGLVRQVYVRGIGLRRAVIIGGLEEVSRAIERLRDERLADQYIEGHLTPTGQADPTALGDLSRLPWILEERDVQEVIVATALPAQDIRRVAECCFDHGVALYAVPSVTEVVDCRAEPLRMGACPLIRLHPARLEVPSLLLKRAFDLVIASLMLVLTLPLLLMIGVAIKLDSPGPVFYRARRVGLGGRLFSMWKFRSMHPDAEEQEKSLAHLNIYPGGTFKVRDDPRVTRVGRLLRRTSLDELPQLFNVLQGEMSLVGPRPALVSDLDRYEPHHFERLSVIPGMTGAWQVGGRNLITDFETIFRLDRSYIRRWSLLLDVKIMVRTLKVVITGEGAY